MNNTDVLTKEIFNSTDLGTGEEMILPPISEDAESKGRSPKKDRSNGRYSEEDFRNLPREKQHDLAEKYWNGPVSDFDDGTFQFSYTHFGKICNDLGFRKGIVDTQGNAVTTKDDGPIKIYIDHGTRSDVVERKFTLEKETADMLDALFDGVSKSKVANMEKSKIIDAIIRKSFSELLKKKEKGELEVAYRPMEEIRLI